MKRFSVFLCVAAWLATTSTNSARVIVAGEATPAQPVAATGEDKVKSTKTPSAEINEQRLRRMTKDYDLWIDPARHVVVVDGQICLREGNLEMFACPKGTKEHESIVSLNCKAKFIHAALLAVGAKSGKPVEFDPKYSPPTGTVIDVFVLWKDADGKKHEIRAQEWIKQDKTGKPMSYDWVFAGSGFSKDETTGEEIYYAEAGDLICVSNFSTAMLDIPIASSQDNQSLQFSAFTDKIPPRGTKVRLVLAPRLVEKQ